MNGNPYAGIIKELRQESAHVEPLGKVICASPLRVAYRGIEFDSDEILAAEALEAYSVGDTVYVAECGDSIIGGVIASSIAAGASAAWNGVISPLLGGAKNE